MYVSVINHHYYALY